MILIYFARNNKKWTSWQFEHRSRLLPAGLQQRAMRFHKWKDRQASIIGKLLVAHALDMAPASLDLEYTKQQRPFIKDHPDFNISHAGSMVVCACSTTGRVGVDIERIQPLPLQDFQHVFTAEEWNRIHKTKLNTIAAFYSCWTQKEAVLKAVGTGLLTRLQQVHISKNKALVNDQLCTLEKIRISRRYSCHVAMEIPQPVLPPVDVTNIIC